MNKTMVFAIVAMTAIIMMSAFNLQIMPHASVVVPNMAAGSELYVCPAADTMWDSFANMARMFSKPIWIIVLFGATILMFTWGWAFYQNLLKDKFDRGVYKKPWGFTKLLFWAIVAIVLCMYTPNHFRGVSVTGMAGEWVLCQDDTPGAIAVRADAVKP